MSQLPLNQIVCGDNGRRFIGIEINQEYCDIANKRLAQKLLDFGVEDTTATCPL